MTDVETWSQLISSIAVLATLIYLAIEIRQNTAAAHAATRLGITNASAAELFKLVDYPEITICMVQNDPLTPEQSSRLHNWLAAYMRHMEYTWLQHKNRLAEGYYWEADRQIIRAVLGTPRTESWWQGIGRHVYGRTFVEEVDGILKDQPHSELLPRIFDWGAQKMAA